MLLLNICSQKPPSPGAHLPSIFPGYSNLCFHYQLFHSGLYTLWSVLSVILWKSFHSVVLDRFSPIVFALLPWRLGRISTLFQVPFNIRFTSQSTALEAHPARPTPVIVVSSADTLAHSPHLKQCDTLWVPHFPCCLPTLHWFSAPLLAWAAMTSPYYFLNNFIIILKTWPNVTSSKRPSGLCAS